MILTSLGKNLYRTIQSKWNRSTEHTDSTSLERLQNKQRKLNQSL